MTPGSSFDWNQCPFGIAYRPTVCTKPRVTHVMSCHVLHNARTRFQDSQERCSSIPEALQLVDFVRSFVLERLIFLESYIRKVLKVPWSHTNKLKQRWRLSERIGKRVSCIKYILLPSSPRVRVLSRDGEISRESLQSLTTSKTSAVSSKESIYRTPSLT
jgi:hypothetical protein